MIHVICLAYYLVHNLPLNTHFFFFKSVRNPPRHKMGDLHGTMGSRTRKITKTWLLNSLFRKILIRQIQFFAILFLPHQSHFAISKTLTWRGKIKMKRKMRDSGGCP